MFIAIPKKQNKQMKENEQANKKLSRSVLRDIKTVIIEWC